MLTPMPPRKVIDLPEAQLVGALELQVDSLSAAVQQALRDGQAQRDGQALADEAERLLWPRLDALLSLDALTFPAHRDEVVRAARDAGLPASSIDLLRNLPCERYDNLLALRADFSSLCAEGVGERCPRENPSRPP